MEKGCNNCKWNRTDKIGCKHPQWNRCIVRDDANFVTDYIQFEPKEVRDLNPSDIAKMKAHVGVLCRTVESLIQTLVTENPNAEYGPAVREAKNVLLQVEGHRIERYIRRSK